MENCHCCGWRCGVNRKTGEKGFCRLTDISNYASEFLHMGEEPELIPPHMIFFTGCTFACVYCQNWISLPILKQEPKSNPGNLQS
jgi:putative pyruvate formate lyase activating enzyme